MSQRTAFDCPGGYWSSEINNEESTGEVLACVPVGEGFFSPDNDSFRYPCAPGTFSDLDSATVCQVCLPGSYADQPKSTVCKNCPRGFFSSTVGALQCQPCNDLYYDGLASDYAIVLTPQQTGQDEDDLYCLEPLEGAVYAQPTFSPTMVPTLAPSVGAEGTLAPTAGLTETETPLPTSTLPESPVVTQAPTMAPSPFETLSPSILGTQEPLIPGLPNAEVSGFDEGAWKSQSLSNYWLPAALAVFLAIAMGLAVIWTYPTENDAPQDGQTVNDEDDPRPPESFPMPCNSRESVSNIFFDEEEEPHLSQSKYATTWRDVEGGHPPSGSVSEVWSLSIGFGARNGYESSEESKTSSDMLSI